MAGPADIQIEDAEACAAARGFRGRNLGMAASIAWRSSGVSRPRIADRHRARNGSDAVGHDGMKRLLQGVERAGVESQDELEIARVKVFRSGVAMALSRRWTAKTRSVEGSLDPATSRATPRRALRSDRPVRSGSATLMANSVASPSSAARSAGTDVRIIVSTPRSLARSNSPRSAVAARIAGARKLRARSLDLVAGSAVPEFDVPDSQSVGLDQRVQVSGRDGNLPPSRSAAAVRKRAQEDSKRTDSLPGG